MRAARGDAGEASVAESIAMIYLDRRRAGLLRRARAPARRDRLLAVARPRSVVLGDLVNRGPGSLATLRRLRAPRRRRDLPARQPRLAPARGGARRAPAARERHARRHPRRARSRRLDRLAARPPHGGARARLADACTPASRRSGTCDSTLRLAREVERHLQSDALADFLQVMYGNEPARWSDDLDGNDRLRFIVNVLTRIRFVRRRRHAGLQDQGRRGAAAAGPVCRWFDAPGRRTAGVPIAFGHWSTLGLRRTRPTCSALDTGCVWGGRSPRCASTAAGATCSRWRASRRSKPGA